MPIWQEQCVTIEPPMVTVDFRNALGSFPTGVCIITTRRRAGKRKGLTAGSFNTVSLTPPTILWSLTRSSPSAEAFRNCEYFAVNVLAAEHRAISSHFARKSEDKFAPYEAEFEDGLGGSPLLTSAAVVFQCRHSFQNYGGDQIVFVGAVDSYASTDRAPLVFHRGRYADLA